MSIYSNVTEKDLYILRKLAEQQKNQRALKIKNRSLKETHDVKLAESLSPITKRLDELNKCTKELGEIAKESQHSESRTSAIDNTTTSQSLRDT